VDFPGDARVKFYLFLVLLLAGPFFPRVAHAYPEMVRHGYVNCMACHTTPHGGDMLSMYGRELGKELLSRNDSVFKSSGAKEKNYLEIETPEWLNVGASARFLQAFSESSIASKAQFVIMQIDIDALTKLYEEKIKLYASIGRFEPSKADAEWQDFIYTPRVWVQYQENWGGSKVSFLRAGRFFPAYGLQIPEHNFVTRKNLGFNPGQERVAAEATWSDEDYQFSATALFQRAQFADYVPEKGYVLQASKVFGKNARAGINMYRSTLTQSGADTKQSFEGVYALIGWDEQITTLVQADRLNSPDGKTGFLDLFKLSYEWIPGLQVAAFQQYSNSDTQKTGPHQESFGVEVYYFPLPNFNLSAALAKQKDSAELDEQQTKAWFVAHFYL
jgi:hypothetical protein